MGLNSVFILIIFFIPAIIAAGVLAALRKYKKRKYRRPFSKGLLRTPGESVHKEWMDVSDTASSHFALALFFPALMVAHYVISVHYFDVPDSVITRSAMVIIVGGVLVWLVVGIITNMMKAEKLYLGYKAEVAVSQELNLLYAKGFHVFHDFPAENFNIDHVVVGPTGVFAVETKGRSRPVRVNRSGNHKVVFKGQSLEFPTWMDYKTIDQANRQSKWLRKWLSSAVGQQISVMPAIALPGWFIEQKAKSSFILYNGRNPEKIFPKRQVQALTEKEIIAIVHQLDQRCRWEK
jgi:hypothetical protein